MMTTHCCVKGHPHDYWDIALLDGLFISDGCTISHTLSKTLDVKNHTIYSRKLKERLVSIVRTYKNTTLSNNTSYTFPQDLLTCLDEPQMLFYNFYEHAVKKDNKLVNFLVSIIDKADNAHGDDNVHCQPQVYERIWKVLTDGECLPDFEICLTMPYDVKYVHYKRWLAESEYARDAEQCYEHWVIYDQCYHTCVGIYIYDQMLHEEDNHITDDFTFVRDYSFIYVFTLVLEEYLRVKPLTPMKRFALRKFRCTNTTTPMTKYKMRVLEWYRAVHQCSVVHNCTMETLSIKVQTVSTVYY